MVKKDFHAATGFSRLAEAYSKTASTWPRPTPGNHSKNSSTEAPSSKFSNKARTGTLVPRKTQDPPTLLGLCSTLLHWSQKFIETRYQGKDHPQPKFLFQNSYSNGLRRGGSPPSWLPTIPVAAPGANFCGAYWESCEPKGRLKLWPTRRSVLKVFELELRVFSGDSSLLHSRGGSMRGV